jgi:hypothetical protein
MSDSNPSTDPAAPQLYCGNCGAPIPTGKHFCPVCLAPTSLATPTPPETQPATPPSAIVPPTPPGPTPTTPLGPEIPTPDGPTAPEPGVATPVVPTGPQAPTPAPAVIPLPPGAPPPTQPAAPAGPPLVGTYLPPPPPAPPAETGPSSWWLVLTIVGAMGAVIPLFAACILLWVAGNTQDPSSTRLWAIFCCLLPGLLMGVAAVVGWKRYFRKKP